MKKTTFIIIFKIVLLLSGYAQKNVITKIVIPQKISISFFKPSTLPYFDHSLIRINKLQGSVNNSRIFFNNQQLIKYKKAVNNPVLIFTELSSSDVLENSLNNLKTDLISTYDDHITELFKDAPSLVKLKCIITL